MSNSVEIISNLGRRVTIVVPVDEIEQKIAKRKAEVAQTIKLDGFRKGKVPVDEVERRYGKSIRDEVTGDLLQTSLNDLLTKENLQPAGQPVIENIKANKGEPLEYVVTFEIYPSVNLAEFDKYKIEKTVGELTEPDINYVVQNILKQQADWHEVDRAAQDGDRLTVDFVGTLNGEPFQGGTAQGVNLIIGSKRFIPGFEEGLLGVKAGDKRDLNVTFPENYGEPTLAGKPAQFAVTVTKVEEPKLPELNEEFIKRMGVSDGTVESFHNLVKTHMQNELDKVLRQKIKAQIFEQMVAMNPVELPKALVESEVDFLHKQMHQHEGEGEVAHGHHEHPELQEDAKRRVTLSLIFREIINKHSLTPDTGKITQLIMQAAQGFEDMDMVRKWLSSDKESRMRFESIALEEQIVDLVMEKANVTEKRTSYGDIMQIQGIDK